jgi:hypothetical protein
MLGALAWIAAASFGMYLLVAEQGPLGPKLIVSGLIIIGIAWFLWQAGRFIRLAAEGAAHLALEEAPVIGGRLRATLRLPGRIAHASHVMAVLACVRDGNASRVAPNAYSSGTTWTAQRELPLRHEGGAGVAALELEIPAGCQPTGTYRSHSLNRRNAHRIDWQVCVSAVLGRELVERRFDLQVLVPQPPATVETIVRDAAALALILANLVPVALMFMGRAEPASLAYLYWAENLIVAFFMLLRVVYAGRGSIWDKVGSALFFSIWFVAVAVFLGVILLEMLLHLPRGWDREYVSITGWAGAVLAMMGSQIARNGLVVAVLALFVSHGIGFVQNYLRNGRYLQAWAGHEMDRLARLGQASFAAVFVVGGLAALHAPAYVVAVVVVIKVAFELWRHAREREPSPSAAQAADTGVSSDL